MAKFRSLLSAGVSLAALASPVVTYAHNEGIASQENNVEIGDPRTYCATLRFLFE